MTIACLGPEGTFSHEVALSLSDDIVLLPTIKSVFRHVERGECDGVVPLENSEAGGVGATLDCLQACEIFITSEIYIPIRHNLVSYVPVEDMTVIYAHPQTHEQCSDFIERIGVPVVHTASNAASVQEMLRVAGSGAITSLMAAEKYGAPVIAPDVQNSADNVTRFVRISSGPTAVGKPEKCSLLIDPKTNRPGLLYDLLRLFAGRDINLTRIESRPSKRGIGSYVFFIDFEVKEGWEAVIRNLHDVAVVKELGCYRNIGVSV